MTRSSGEPSDGALVQRCLGGDSSAFSTLVSRHERRVYNLAFRLLGRHEDARDATQETFLSCYRRLSTFRGDAAFTTWLHRIAVNASYDMLRKRPLETSLEDPSLEGPGVPDHSEASATAIDVQRALASVPLEFRAALVMRDVQGFAYEDIAKALQLPIGTVKSRLHRGRVALGRLMSGEPLPASGPSKPGDA